MCLGFASEQFVSWGRGCVFVGDELVGSMTRLVRLVGFERFRGLIVMDCDGVELT